jgi:hypothetical protein
MGTAVGAIGGLVKPNMILISVLGSVLLLLRWAYIERPSESSWTLRRLLALGLAALPIVASAASTVGWMAVAAIRQGPGITSDPTFLAVMRSDLGPLSRLADEIGALVHPDWGTAPGPGFTALDTPLLGAAGAIVVLATLGACISAWLWHTDFDLRAVIVLRSVAIAIPISAAVLVVIYWSTSQGGYWAASRFGVPFLAAASVGLGASVARRAALPVGLLGVFVWLCAWVGLVT